MRNLIAVTALVIATAAFTCWAADAPVTVVVSGPTAIGFFPLVSQKEMDEDDGGLSEGIAHVQFALEDVASCLSALKPTVTLELTRSLSIMGGSTEYRYDFPSDWRHDVGVVLVAPGRKPEIIYVASGPSELIETAPQAAYKYFSEPKCKRFEESDAA